MTVRPLSFYSRSYDIAKALMLFAIIIFAHPAHGQIIGSEDESKLYADTKQVNQFFRRFNGEEDEKGERYYARDKQYRNPKLRKKYLGILFDAQNPNLKGEQVTQFAKDVLDNNQFLNFHGGNWFSEVQATFSLNGVDHTFTLFMELEKHLQGTRWVMSKVYGQVFDPYFQRDTMRVGKFLHPLSHELAFMNFRKAFSNPDSVSQFAVKRFRPDHLSVFLYEMKRGNLRFKSVESMKFHFFQVKGWYFELSEFNRPGNNSGWLISNLVKVNNEQEQAILKKYLYYEK